LRRTSPRAAAAQNGKPKPEVTVAKLVGAWLATFVGRDWVRARDVHSQFFRRGDKCHAEISHRQLRRRRQYRPDFTIDTLSADGSGTATLKVSGSSKIALAIQVSGNSQVMNMVDITDSNHYKAATAVKR
jgi:hypothetical protein